MRPSAPSRATLLLFAFLAPACGGGAGEGSAGEPAATRPRNVLLISVDTLRADRLGCYGAGRDTSPTVDRLAARGVLVEDVSATSPWTLPSHASLLTGLYPARHGVRDRERRLPDALPTLASLLAGAGLRTHAVVNAQHVGARYGLDRGFEEYEYVSEWEVRADGSRRIANRAEEVGARALAWLEGLAPDEPWLLFLHFYDVHTDLDPDPRWRRAFAGEPYAGAPSGRTDELLAARAGQRPLDARDAAWLLALYDAEVRTFDERLGSLLGRLEETGRLADTLVVVTSDHGEEFLEHGSLLHGRTYFQEVIAIPLVLAGPGVPAGARLPGPASLVDVAPTVLAALGVPAPADLDGRDLGPALRDPRAAGALRERVLFAEADHNNRVPDLGRMARRDARKLVWERVGGNAVLFDLARDPRERSPLPPSAWDGAARGLMARLEAFLALEPAAGDTLPGLTEEEEQRLRDLGY